MKNELSPSVNNCYHCPYRAGWQSFRQLESSDPAPPWLKQAAPTAALPASIYRKKANRAPTLTADVITPAGRAVAIGIAAGLLSAWGWLVGWPWYAPLAAGGTVTALALIRFTLDQTGLFDVEEVTQAGPESPSPPSPAPTEPLRLEVSQAEPNHYRQSLIELPPTITDKAFYRFCKATAEGGASLAHSDWTGRAGLFSKPAYRAMLTELDRAGLTAFVDPDKPTMGRRLTGAGKRAMLKFVAEWEQNR